MTYLYFILNSNPGMYVKRVVSSPKFLWLLGGLMIAAPFTAALPKVALFFKESGTAGDTFGGMTSPFINLIGAILVYKAFKEQINANDLIQKQQYFQHIQDQIQRLEDDFLKINDVAENIRRSVTVSLENLDSEDPESRHLECRFSMDDLNKVKYAIHTLLMVRNWVAKLTTDRDIMTDKLSLVYKVFYLKAFENIEKRLKQVKNIHSDTKEEEKELIELIDATKVLIG